MTCKVLLEAHRTGYMRYIKTYLFWVAWCWLIGKSCFVIFHFIYNLTMPAVPSAIVSMWLHPSTWKRWCFHSLLDIDVHLLATPHLGRSLLLAYVHVLHPCSVFEFCSLVRPPDRYTNIENVHSCTRECTSGILWCGAETSAHTRLVDVSSCCPSTDIRAVARANTTSFKSPPTEWGLNHVALSLTMINN